jgi:hypothetical protein
MLMAAQHVSEFVASVELSTYRDNLLVRRAVERELSILGEAARRVSATTRRQHAQVPWRDVIALATEKCTFYLRRAYSKQEEAHLLRQRGKVLDLFVLIGFVHPIDGPGHRVLFQQERLRAHLR